MGHLAATARSRLTELIRSSTTNWTNEFQRICHAQYLNTPISEYVVKTEHCRDSDGTLPGIWERAAYLSRNQSHEFPAAGDIRSNLRSDPLANSDQFFGPRRTNVGEPPPFYTRFRRRKRGPFWPGLLTKFSRTCAMIMAPSTRSVLNAFRQSQPKGRKPTWPAPKLPINAAASI
jgi:hypothetical protein